ncbi:MAG TPA: ATP-binding protein [Ktedonobacteraceae bacterium]|jgi:DNA helicase HerA-like ATPase|nr:ATP-binding protein [Ktedonobacteraceae bacterium]
MMDNHNSDAKMHLPLPDEVFEQLHADTAQAGGAYNEPEGYQNAIGRTMFDLPSSEDNTITILLPRDDIPKAPSQALIRIRSVTDDRTYLGIVVKGPFAEPDGLRGDAPIMITTAVRGGIFMPRYHGRVQVELLGEEADGVLIPPRLRPLPNSPVFVLNMDETSRTLRLDGDIPLGVPVGYEQITAAIPSDKKSVLPRHLGILGTTGGGKSTTVSSLVSSFQQSGMATILIDTEGEYTEIYQPTQDHTMLTALEKRGKAPHGVQNVMVYHLIGRETTCPDKSRTTAFSLQFSQLSPYLVMGMLELNEAQQQRYQKAYDIAKRILWTLRIFPANDAEKQQVYEVDEMETGYPRMKIEHMYDVVRACAEIAAGGKKSSESGGFEYRFSSPDFQRNRDQVIMVLKKETATGIDHAESWRVVQAKLGQMVRLKVFDNAAARSLNYRDLTKPGKVSIIDLSDTDMPMVNNFVIAEFLRGLLEAQDENYAEAEKDESKALPRTMVIIEEAHEFLSRERIAQMPVLYQQVARIARRGRKRWFGLTFVTQLPQHLPDEVLGLINNYILHKISDANVINRLKRSLGVVDDSLWMRLPNLAPGQAIVAMSSFARPLLLNIDPTPCKLRMVE